MSQAILNLQLKVDFVICPKCNKGPKDNSQSKVEKFLKEHATHIESSLQKYPRVTGYLSKPSFLTKKKIAIRLVDEPKNSFRNENCRWKKCIKYAKGNKDFCSKKCKRKYKQYKQRRK